MSNFYFTYGIEGHPFVGGWTMVGANDAEQACALFRAVHPDKTEGVLNCAFVYSEEDFKKTTMMKAGNFGHGCREIIRLQTVVLDHAAS